MVRLKSKKSTLRRWLVNTFENQKIKIKVSFQTDCALVSDKAEFVSVEMKKSDRPDLTSARIVVAGGRALKVISNLFLDFFFKKKKTRNSRFFVQ